MLNFFFTCGQIAALLLCLYGAYLTLRHGDILRTAIRSLEEWAGGRAGVRFGRGSGRPEQARFLPR